MYLSLLPGAGGMLTWMGIPYFDKILHMGGYGLLSLLWTFAWFKSSAQLPFTREKWVLAGSALMGCALECGQYLMHAGRSFELWDMVANVVGAVLGVAGFRCIRKWRLIR